MNVCVSACYIIMPRCLEDWLEGTAGLFKPLMFLRAYQVLFSDHFHGDGMYISRKSISGPEEGGGGVESE